MGVKGSQKGNLRLVQQGKIEQSHGMDKKERYKMEQGEETDTKKDQERVDSSGGGQQTQAKPPPTQSGSQEPHPAYGGG